MRRLVWIALLVGCDDGGSAEPQPDIGVEDGCRNGVWDRGEDGRDCGGPCEPCPVDEAPSLTVDPTPERTADAALVVTGSSDGEVRIAGVAVTRDGPAFRAEITLLEGLNSLRVEGGTEERAVVERTIELDTTPPELFWLLRPMRKVCSVDSRGSAGSAAHALPSAAAVWARPACVRKPNSNSVSTSSRSRSPSQADRWARNRRRATLSCEPPAN